VDNSLEKSFPSTIKEKGQYLLAFGVIASMLVVTNFPVLVIFFFAVFAYLLLKMFSAAGRSETRDIFEFYLTSNEILRDDERRWFGFEIHEAILRGESINQRMNAAPPLVGFTLGALYNKVGDHKMAVSYLSRVLETDGIDEKAFMHPTPELRNYVRVLRKIEREPGDAPLTSAAVRALERARKLRGKSLLQESRSNLEVIAAAELLEENRNGKREFQIGGSVTDIRPNESNGGEMMTNERRDQSITADALSNGQGRKKTTPKTKEEQYSNRKPISEVLHDIYDGNGR